MLDYSQILVATQLAVINQKNKTLKTHSIFSEIIYNLSPNKKVCRVQTLMCHKFSNCNYVLQISDSLKKFGIDEKNTTFFCVVLNKEDIELVCSTVNGELLHPIQNISSTCDEMELKKIFKIKEEELKVGSLLDAIINRISTKEMVTF